MLEQFLPKKHLQRIEKVTSWQEAMKLCATPLLSEKIIEPRYLDNIFRLYEELGAYFVIAPQIAMPHARPEDGAIETGLSLLVVSSGVNFGSDENDPVHLIVMLAAKDSTAHLSVLSELAELLGDDDKVKQIINAKTIDEIFSLIQ